MGPSSVGGNSTPAIGTPEAKLCWGDDTLFVTHLMTTLSTPGFSAKVKFGEPHIYPDRRTAADSTQAEVEAMREQRVAVLQ